MLAVGVEHDDVLQAAIKPVTQACFDRFAFAEIAFVNHHIRARFTRDARGFIRRAVIDHQHVIKLHAGSPNDFSDVLLFAKSGDDRGHRGTIHRGRGW